jgi:hypothetical protein
LLADILHWLHIQARDITLLLSEGHQDAMCRHAVREPKVALPIAPEVGDEVPLAIRHSLIEHWCRPLTQAVFRPADGASIGNVFLSKPRRRRRVYFKN